MVLGVKAIFLRASKQLKETDGERDIVLELKRGEQLTPQDIEEALKHPDIRPAPLFGVDKKSRPPVGQLYFGPGFEERLELEMEEYVSFPYTRYSNDDCLLTSAFLFVFSFLG
jgi:hypothetical protein